MITFGYVRLIRLIAPILVAAQHVTPPSFLFETQLQERYSSGTQTVPQHRQVPYGNACTQRPKEFPTGREQGRGYRVVTVVSKHTVRVPSVGDIVCVHWNYMETRI